MPLFVASLATGGAGGGGIGAVFSTACISCSGVAILPLFTALGLALSSLPKISAIFCCISASRASAAASWIGAIIRLVIPAPFEATVFGGTGAGGTADTPAGAATIGCGAAVGAGVGGIAGAGAGAGAGVAAFICF